MREGVGEIEERPKREGERDRQKTVSIYVHAHTHLVLRLNMMCMDSNMRDWKQILMKPLMLILKD